MTALVSVQPFKAHVCVDCGAKLSKFGAVKCKEYNMKRMGKRRRKQIRIFPCLKQSTLARECYI